MLRAHVAVIVEAAWLEKPRAGLIFVKFYYSQLTLFGLVVGVSGPLEDSLLHDLGPHHTSWVGVVGKVRDDDGCLLVQHQSVAMISKGLLHILYSPKCVLGVRRIEKMTELTKR